MSNTGTMPKIGDGLTQADIEEIQRDAAKNTNRRLNEAKEDGNFTPSPNWKGMESHLRPDTPEYEEMLRNKTKTEREEIERTNAAKFGK